MTKTYNWTVGTDKLSGLVFGKPRAITVGIGLEEQLPLKITGTVPDLFNFIYRDRTIYKHCKGKVLNMVVVRNTLPLGLLAELRQFGRKVDIKITEAKFEGVGKIIKLARAPVM